MGLENATLIADPLRARASAAPAGGRTPTGAPTRTWSKPTSLAGPRGQAMGCRVLSAINGEQAAVGVIRWLSTEPRS